MVNIRQDPEGIDEEAGLDRSIADRAKLATLLDGDGVPTLELVRSWLELFDGNSPIDPQATRWLLAALRFCRPDGSAVFDPRGRSVSRLKVIEGWVRRLGDPSLSAVVARWVLPRSGPSSSHSSLPSPTDSRRDRVLAMLRPDWSPDGAWLAVDHRRVGDQSLVELAARGRAWLGPSWTSKASSGRFSPAIPTSWASGVFADSLEWSYKVGARRVTRSVVFLKGRSMALLGQQVDGRDDPAEIRLELGDGITATPIEGSRALMLIAGRGKPTARLIPLGLPCHDRPGDLGSIAVEDNRVVIRQVGDGRRRWLPVLVCWGKPPISWRPLTVAERSKACRGDVAVATRVSWGPRVEGLVIYRSLGEPTLRTFLGHQTSARYLVGGFTPSGDVRPILKLD